MGESGTVATTSTLLDMNRTAVLNLALPVYCHAHTSPKALALVVDGREYTYADLAAAAGRVAAWLCARCDTGGRGPRVGILASRSFEAYAGILGTVWAGGCFVPLGIKQPADRLSVILNKTNF